jgi:hypothetical protein
MGGGAEPRAPLVETKVEALSCGERHEYLIGSFGLAQVARSLCALKCWARQVIPGRHGGCDLCQHCDPHRAVAAPAAASDESCTDFVGQELVDGAEKHQPSGTSCSD